MSNQTCQLYTVCCHQPRAPTACVLWHFWWQKHTDSLPPGCVHSTRSGGLNIAGALVEPLHHNSLERTSRTLFFTQSKQYHVNEIGTYINVLFIYHPNLLEPYSSLVSDCSDLVCGVNIILWGWLEQFSIQYVSWRNPNPCMPAHLGVQRQTGLKSFVESWKYTSHPMTLMQHTSYVRTVALGTAASAVHLDTWPHPSLYVYGYEVCLCA